MNGIKRRLQILVGSLVALGGIGLLLFAILLIYADLMRTLPSSLVVDLIVTSCSVVGIFCALAGTRLVAGIQTKMDWLLLAPPGWKFIGILFVFLALVLLLRAKWMLALASGFLGMVCYRFSRRLLG